MRERFYNGCKFRESNKTLYIAMSENAEVDTDAINDMIRHYNIKSIKFNNIVSVKCLKEVFSAVKSINVDEDIIIDMNTYINLEPERAGSYRPMIEGLNNRVYLDINNIPNNVKLMAFYGNHEQDEFTTWVHNLNDDNKAKIYKLLDDKCKNLYIEEEIVIKKFYRDIMGMYPNLKSMNKKEAFNLVFDYVKRKYPYAVDCILPDGRIKPECSYAQNPIDTYNNKKGVCGGRAGLLTLVTNNNLLRLNCTSVYGVCGTLQHVWNIYVDEYGKSSDYDLSFDIKDETKVNMVERGYKYRKIYSSVLDRTNSLPSRNYNLKKIGATMIPKTKIRKNKLKPLPPRKNNN